MAKLFEPIIVGRLQLKNRVAMPPMITCHADGDGVATKFHELHYGARALGGVGMIIVEATSVTQEGMITPNDLGIYNEAQLDGHRRIAHAIKSNGAKALLQIAHAGRKSMLQQFVPLAPSAISFGEEFQTPKAMDESDIERIKNAFAEAAKKAKEAGYDGVELHCAHGYLLNEFLSPISNIRTDQYGGSFENRVRLPLEIVDKIKKSIDIDLFVRISATEWFEGGWELEDSVRFAKLLQERGVALVHVSSGGTSSTFDYSSVTKPLYQLPLAAAIKKEVDIAVGAVGLITKAQEAEAIVQNNDADLVFLGRELLRNPQWAFSAQVELGHRPLSVEPAYIRAYQ